MARININTQVEGPDEIKINLVREDYLQTSNTYRVFFEICLAIGSAILGSIISLLNEEKKVLPINWLFLGLMVLGCIAFASMTYKNFQKAKSQGKLKNNPPTTLPTIEILSATYVWPGGQIDLTVKLREFLAIGMDNFVVYPSVLGIQDPAPGIVKRLMVHYKIDGKERNASVSDGKKIKLE